MQKSNDITDKNSGIKLKCRHQETGVKIVMTKLWLKWRNRWPMMPNENGNTLSPQQSIQVLKLIHQVKETSLLNLMRRLKSSCRNITTTVLVQQQTEILQIKVTITLDIFVKMQVEVDFCLIYYPMGKTKLSPICTYQNRRQLVQNWREILF